MTYPSDVGGGPSFCFPLHVFQSGLGEQKIFSSIFTLSELYWSLGKWKCLNSSNNWVEERGGYFWDLERKV